MKRNFNLTLLLAFTLFAVGIKASAADQCDLSGGASFEVACENKMVSLSLRMAGQNGEELNDNIVTYKTFQLKSDVERDLPISSFERTDIGIFTALFSKNNALFKLIGIPKTFKIKNTKLTMPPGAVEGEGSFEGIVTGSTDLYDDSKKIETKVSCTFNMVACPR